MREICAGLRASACWATASAIVLLAACGDTQQASPQTAPATPTAASTEAATSAATEPTAATEPPQPLQATEASWKPEALEELLAPIALYPDPVLAQVLTASTNPQEVLDAGNWLVANPNLEGKALDEAAEKAGFTPPIRALIQFPDVIDTMCLQMDWTEELGQAFVNDQAGVMDAVQRLRAQAKDVGTLKSSEQMKVSTEKKEGKEVITVAPPSPQVVYVPQYDPAVVYSAPATATAPAPTTASTESTGHSTGELVATGLLAFGAGMVVNEIFDDDDDYWHGGYSNMWYRPMPYYPPHPYRPVYGGGFYPAHAYNRPNNYVRNNVVVVNKNNNYFNRYDSRSIERNRVAPRSPITAARPNRTELNQLNAQAAQGPRRQGPASSDAWKGKSTYAGATPAGRDAAKSRAASAKSKSTTAPKLQGSYAGAKPSASHDGTRVADARTARSTSGARDIQRPDPSSVSRDRAQAADAARSRANSASTAHVTPASRPTATPAAHSGGSGFSGANRGSADRVASQRGHASVPAGGAAKARSAGAARHR